MIRYATKEDIPRIAEILVFGKRVAYRAIFNDDEGSFNKLQVLGLIEEYQNSPHLIDNMLVYDDGIIKGIINQKEYENEAELCDFYVDPFFRGQGIGRQLMQSFIEEVKKKGKGRVILWVIKDNLPTRRFYEKNGFHTNGQERLIEGTAVWDLFYERELMDQRNS